jgi:metal-responsive CopG/Arc/MetJ family transcriptional regulator
MPSFAPPLSVSITEAQLAWLDQRRSHGALSRSAVLRQVIDAAIAAERAGLAMPGPVLAAAANRR